MKNLLPLTLLALTLSACSATDEADTAASPVTDGRTLQTASADAFAISDGAARLSYSPAAALQKIVQKTSPDHALTMGETQITEAQMAEIKAYVDGHLVGSSKYKTYRNIFNWIVKNMTYASSGNAYLEPYDVFTYKRCICQGYANLLKTMCISQGIPCFVVNGYLSNIGGHAWCYVHDGTKWIVSDPTNNQDYNLTSLSSYENWLMPQRTDIEHFEDEGFAYGFYDNELCVTRVKEAAGQNYISVPYSVEGMRVTMFHPLTAVPSQFTTLYLAKNIETLGNDPSSLTDLMPTISEIYVEEGSTRLEAYKSVLYLDGNESPYFIPAAIRRIELRPMKAVEKNTLYYLPGVEEVVVAEGTERIEAYAFEQCPNLKTIYVPESVSYIDPDAVYRCGSDWKIVRTSTGIRPVYK